MESAARARLRALAAAEATRQYSQAELYEDVAYYGEETAMQWAIAAALARVPRAVQDFALATCRFVAIGHLYRGLTIPAAVCSGPREGSAEALDAAPPERYWLIVLDGRMLTDPCPEETVSTIAHELAHAWLGHDCRPTLTPRADGEAAETAACLQAQHWGFTGTGTQP